MAAKYKSEILAVSFKFLKSTIKEEEVRMLDELINKRSSEGWELVTYAFMGGGAGNIARGILLTFKKAEY